MSPVAWALRPLQHYADFGGRSPRSEYWWFTLFQWLTYVVLAVFFVAVVGTASGAGQPPAFFWVVLGIGLLFVVTMVIPNVAVMVRRLHDQDLSGWFILLTFIPYVGGIVAIVFMC